MKLSYRYTNCKQKEIGTIFGVDYSTVNQNRVLLKTKLKSNRKLKKQFHSNPGTNQEVVKYKDLTHLPSYFHSPGKLWTTPDTAYGQKLLNEKKKFYLSDYNNEITFVDFHIGRLTNSYWLKHLTFRGTDIPAIIFFQK